MSKGIICVVVLILLICLAFLISSYYGYGLSLFSRGGTELTDVPDHDVLDQKRRDAFVLCRHKNAQTHELIEKIAKDRNFLQKADQIVPQSTRASFHEFYHNVCTLEAETKQLNKAAADYSAGRELAQNLQEALYRYIIAFNKVSTFLTPSACDHINAIIGGANNFSKLQEPFDNSVIDSLEAAFIDSSIFKPAFDSSDAHITGKDLTMSMAQEIYRQKAQAATSNYVFQKNKMDSMVYYYIKRMKESFIDYVDRPVGPTSDLSQFAAISALNNAFEYINSVASSCNKKLSGAQSVLHHDRNVLRVKARELVQDSHAINVLDDFEVKSEGRAQKISSHLDKINTVLSGIQTTSTDWPTQLVAIESLGTALHDFAALNVPTWSESAATPLAELKDAANKYIAPVELMLNEVRAQIDPAKFNEAIDSLREISTLSSGEDNKARQIAIAEYWGNISMKRILKKILKYQVDLFNQTVYLVNMMGQSYAKTIYSLTRRLPKINFGQPLSELAHLYVPITDKHIHTRILDVVVKDIFPDPFAIVEPVFKTHTHIPFLDPVDSGLITDAHISEYEELPLAFTINDPNDFTNHYPSEEAVTAVTTGNIASDYEQLETNLKNFVGEIRSHIDIFTHDPANHDDSNLANPLSSPAPVYLLAITRAIDRAQFDKPPFADVDAFRTAMALNFNVYKNLINGVCSAMHNFETFVRKVAKLKNDGKFSGVDIGSDDLEKVSVALPISDPEFIANLTWDALRTQIVDFISLIGTWIQAVKIIPMPFSNSRSELGIIGRLLSVDEIDANDKEHCAFLFETILKQFSELFEDIQEQVNVTWPDPGILNTVKTKINDAIDEANDPDLLKWDDNVDGHAQLKTKMNAMATAIDHVQIIWPPAVNRNLSKYLSAVEANLTSYYTTDGIKPEYLTDAVLPIVQRIIAQLNALENSNPELQSKPFQFIAQYIRAYGAIFKEWAEYNKVETHAPEAAGIGAEVSISAEDLTLLRCPNWRKWIPTVAQTMYDTYESDVKNSLKLIVDLCVFDHEPCRAIFENVIESASRDSAQIKDVKLEIALDPYEIFETSHLGREDIMLRTAELLQQAFLHFTKFIDDVGQQAIAIGSGWENDTVKSSVNIQTFTISSDYTSIQIPSDAGTFAQLNKTIETLVNAVSDWDENYANPLTPKPLDLDAIIITTQPASATGPPAVPTGSPEAAFAV